MDAVMRQTRGLLPPWTWISGLIVLIIVILAVDRALIFHNLSAGISACLNRNNFSSY